MSLRIFLSHVRTPPLLSPDIVSNGSNKRFRTEIKAEKQEVRVCTNRTCRRQGSIQILDALSGLAPPEVVVKSCGCLGRCGAGPNLVVLPGGQIFGYCATAARAAEVMLGLCSRGCDAGAISKALEGLALTQRVRSELENGNFSQAELVLSQAIDLEPLGGIHVMYRYRSLARLSMGNLSGALEDATQALTLAPNYAEAYICQGDAFLAMAHYDLAEKSYSICLQVDPSLRRSKSFKARIAKLQEKLAAVDRP